ncbi:MAG: MFS transporter [Myxococcales bacterium]
MALPSEVPSRPPVASAGWGRLPGAVWLFGLASLLNDASSEAIFPLLGVFMGAMGAPMRVIGLVLGLADALAVGIKVVAGLWSDRVRRRPLVIAGYLIAAAGKAAVALSSTPWQVLAGRSLDRAGKGIRSGARDAMLTDAVARTERGRAFGVQQSMDHLGAAIGPLVASGCLAGGLSMRATFGVAAALGVTPALLLWWRLREVPRSLGVATEGREVGREGVKVPVCSLPVYGDRLLGNPSANAPSANAPSANAPSANAAPTGTEAERGLGAYVAACGIFALANSSDAFVLVRAAKLGWSPAAIPLLWLGHHAVKSVTSAIGGALSDRIPRVRMVLGGWLAYAGAYLGFALASRRWHILALLIFYAVYHGLAEAPERALVSDLAGPTRRGRAFGLYHGVVGLASLPASVLTGWLWDRSGAGAAFGACASLAVLAAVVLLLLVRSGVLATARNSPSVAP